MPSKEFKVLRCGHCGTLTYKRAMYKNARCPICRKKLTGDPIKLFGTAKDAIAFIKQQKLAQATKGGPLFETFG